MRYISIEILRTLLKAEISTGKLMWNHRPKELFATKRAFNTWNARWAGKEAFTALSSDGYFMGAIFGSTYRAHRIVWALHYGDWPDNQIDHINGDKTDNRVLNLRQASQMENNRNCALSKNNKSGYNGVYFDGRRNTWRAFITINYKTISLGSYVGKEMAIAMRKNAEINYGFHENHGRKAA